VHVIVASLRLRPLPLTLPLLPLLAFPLPLPLLLALFLLPLSLGLPLPLSLLLFLLLFLPLPLLLPRLLTLLPFPPLFPLLLLLLLVLVRVERWDLKAEILERLDLRLPLVFHRLSLVVQLPPRLKVSLVHVAAAAAAAAAGLRLLGALLVARPTADPVLLAQPLELLRPPVMEAVKVRLLQQVRA